MILNEYDMLDTTDKKEQTLYDLDEQQTWTKFMIAMFVWICKPEIGYIISEIKE